MAEALGAFKMQLDARRDPPVRETGFYGVVVRESEFPAQLPEPPRAIPQPQLLPPMCQGFNMGQMTVVFSDVHINGDPDAPLSALNGTWTLNFAGDGINDEGQQFCAWALDIEGDSFVRISVEYGNPFLSSGWSVSAGAPNSSFGASNVQLGVPAPNEISEAGGGTVTLSF